MKKIILAALFLLIASTLAYAGASLPTQWPTAGNAVVSAGPGNYSPTGKPLAGSGSAIVTGPSSVTNGNVAYFTGSSGQVADSGVPSSGLVSLTTTNDFLACYLFTETGLTGGSSLPDHCNSNPATIGSVANLPIQTGYGWQFVSNSGTYASSGSVVFPTALLNAKTMYFAIYNPPAVGGNYNVLSSGGDLLANTTPITSGAIAITNQSGRYTNNYNAIYGFTENVGNGSYGGNTTVASDLLTGFHIWTFVCGTSSGNKDVLYLDGVVVSNYLANGYSCASLPIAGQYELPSVNTTAETAYAYYFSANAHTKTQVQQNYAAIKAIVAQRGVAVTPYPYVYSVPQYFATGDSITCGYQAGGSPICASGTPYTPGTTSTNAYSNLLSLTQTYGISSFGATGAFIQQQVAAAPNVYAPLCFTSNGTSIASLFEGSNNFASGGQNPSVYNTTTTWNAGVAWSTTLHKAGCKTIFINMVSRATGTSQSPNTFDQWKVLYNQVSRANWQNAFDDYIDLEADPILGPNGASTNTTYWYSDETHPILAGQQEIAAAVSAHINYLAGGSTPSNPNPVPVTAATYASTSLDGGLNFNTASNSITDTLFSAEWWSGRNIARCNNSTSGNNTLTIHSPSDYPFNNVSGNTSVQVPNGSCVQFQATFSPGSYVATTGNQTSGSNSLTSVGTLAGMSTGEVISGMGIPYGTTISALSGTTITMSANATATITANPLTTVVALPYDYWKIASSQLNAGITNGATFTISGCSATSPTGSSTAGTIVSGTTGTCTPVITLPASKNGWSCSAADETTPADTITQTASTTTTATLSGTTISGDVIGLHCTGY